jgi:hypothetical protein
MSIAFWILSGMVGLLPSISEGLPTLAFISTRNLPSSMCRPSLHPATPLFVGMQWDDPLFYNATTATIPSVGTLVIRREQKLPKDNYLKPLQRPVVKMQELVRQPLSAAATTTTTAVKKDEEITSALGGMFDVGITAMNGLLIGGVLVLSLLSPAPAEKSKAPPTAMVPTKEQQQRLVQNKASRDRFLKEQQDLEEQDMLTTWNSGGFYF